MRRAQATTTNFEELRWLEVLLDLITFLHEELKRRQTLQLLKKRMPHHFSNSKFFISSRANRISIRIRIHRTANIRDSINLDPKYLGNSLVPGNWVHWFYEYLLALKEVIGTNRPWLIQNRYFPSLHQLLRFYNICSMETISTNTTRIWCKPEYWYLVEQATKYTVPFLPGTPVHKNGKFKHEKNDELTWCHDCASAIQVSQPKSHRKP